MTTKHVYTAITDVMASLAGVGISKDHKNEQQGYKFRGIDDIYNALAQVLAKNKLCILPSVKKREVVERQTSRGTPLFYVNVDVDFEFVSAVDGSSHIVSVSGEAMDSADKATNKAMSAAYKYACLQTFCIPTQGDNDADATTHEVAGKKKPTGAAEVMAQQTDVDAITNLAKLAGVDLSTICSAMKIENLNELPAAKVAAVVDRLQSKLKEQA